MEVAGTPVVWKEKHLRVPLRQDGRMLWLKAWGFAERIGELAPGSRVDAALVLEKTLTRREGCRMERRTARRAASRRAHDGARLN